MQTQMSFFDEPNNAPPHQEMARSGTFVDNLSLPVHRWFRYSAGFAAEWVERVLSDWRIGSESIVLDPFAGSGTVCIVCDTLDIGSIGVEAHPFVSRIAKAKTLWTAAPALLDRFASEVLANARSRSADIGSYPDLIRRSYDDDTLALLDNLKASWSSLKDSSPESELIWLVLTAILRPTSIAGTAQWQYILPNKSKKRVMHPLSAFRQQVEMMKSDLRWMQIAAKRSRAEVITGDARDLANLVPGKVDAVITSPPYANNYDYADALRFEMTFWGEVRGWGDIHDTVRKNLIVSTSQHSSRERLQAGDLLESEPVRPIQAELSAAVTELARVRDNHGGKKAYHTMIGAYCRDISLVLRQLRISCREGARMCWVVGDSAPYGVYCPIERWIGELALAAGFRQFRFDKLRDRNIKWLNRKHRVPLKEGLLWIEG